MRSPASDSESLDLRGSKERFDAKKWERRLMVAVQEVGDLRVPLTTFARHVAAFAAPGQSLEDFVKEVDLPALYLTCGCALGDRKAIGIFESRYFKEVDFAYARMRLSALSRDDARQLVRCRLFVAQDCALPRIATYQGKGELASWTRVVAMRVLVNVMNRKSNANERPVDDVLLDALSPTGPDVEIEILKQQYGSALHSSLLRAIAALADDDRLLLRWELKGLSGTQIGKMRQVHPRTMQRRIAEMHQRIALALQQELKALSIESSDGRSLIRLMLSQLAIELSSTPA